MLLLLSDLLLCCCYAALTVSWDTTIITFNVCYNVSIQSQSQYVNHPFSLNFNNKVAFKSHNWLSKASAQSQTL